jgi:hypothetical protein
MSVSPAEKFAIESYLNFLFPDCEMQNYLFDSLRSPSTMIWYGSGNNGKTTFGKILCSNWAETILKHAYDNPIASSDAWTFIYETNDDTVAPHLMQKTSWKKLRVVVFQQRDMSKFPLSVEEVKALPWGQYLTERIGSVIEGSAPIEMPLDSRNFYNRISAGYEAYFKDAVTKKPFLNVVEDATPEEICKNNKINNKDTNTVVYANPNAVRSRIEVDETQLWTQEQEQQEEEWVYAPIEIRMKKHDGSADDVLTIQPDPESDNFMVTFEQPAEESWVTLYMPQNKLNAYLSTFFSAATWSSDLYSAAQFFVPFFPSTTVSQDEAFDYATRELLPQIAFHLDDWPVLTE